MEQSNRLTTSVLRLCHLIFLTGLSPWLCSSLVYSQADAPSGSRPNILFAFADDWGKYASAYADTSPPSTVVATPHFDRVAREGALFHQAFVTAPSCTPCRSSLLSGQYFWRTGQGAILQGAVWNERIPSFPLLLADGGYHIGHSYKVWSPGRPSNAPYGAKKFAYNRRGNRFSRFSQTVSSANDTEAAKKTLFDEVRGNFRDFIAERPSDAPFCYWFGPTNCHRKWTRGSGKALWGIDPNGLRGKMPPFLPDVAEVREDFADYLGEVQAFDSALGVLLDELEALGELDNTLIIVSGDHGIPGFPRAKCNLYDFGVAVPLAIRWGAVAAGGREIRDFVNLMDLAPTLLEAAGEPVPDVMTGRSLVNVLNSEMSGQVDPERTFVVTGRERHVAAARPGHLPYPQRAIRTKDFLYIRNFHPERWPMGVAPGFGLPEGPWPTQERLTQNTFSAFGDFDASPTKAFLGRVRHQAEMKPYVDFAFGRRPAEELYDLRLDPHQMNNVASQTNYQSTREQLSDQLWNVLTETGDPRVTDASARYERPPFAGPLAN